MSRRRQGGHSVGPVVVAGQGKPFHPAKPRSGQADFKTTVGVRPTCLPPGFAVEPFDGCPAPTSQNAVEGFFTSVRHQQAIPRQSSHQMMKLRLDGSKISEDIRMIELQIIQDRGPGLVMNEFRALVAKRGVVFVGLDHKEGGVGQPGRNAKALRHTANEKRRIQSGFFQNPRQQCRGGGLAVRSGHPQHPPSPKDILSKPLRPGDICQVAIKNRFQQRVPP